MGALLVVGRVVFVLAPLVLWFLVAGLSHRGGEKKLRAIVSGHDGRLSLSRLQAFAWTMILFGSFCAAMAVHPRIVIASDDDRTAAKSAYDAAAAAQKTSEEAKKSADLALQQARNSGDKAKIATAQQSANNAAKDLDDKKSAAAKAKLKWRKMSWVAIPSQLLALAGISLGSGVFASVIAASNDNGKDPAVTKVAFNAVVAAPPPKGTAPGPNWLQITGVNFGATGTVRLNGVYVNVIYWTDTDIGVDADAAGKYDRIAVDTPNGKLAYALTLTGVPPKLTLGPRIIKSEWSDLFRDDTAPDTVSLMKVQMFGWTVVGVLFYVIIFLGGLSYQTDTLPVIDSTIVMLMGLSQTGYLAGKGASSMNK
jgi:hypothetical protein